MFQISFSRFLYSHQPKERVSTGVHANARSRHIPVASIRSSYVALIQQKYVANDQSQSISLWASGTMWHVITPSAVGVCRDPVVCVIIVDYVLGTRRDAYSPGHEQRNV